MPPSHEIPTPPFAMWALAAECIYREEAAAEDPMRVEQVLRPLRSCAEALGENRCSDNVCLRGDWNRSMPADEAWGFVLSDTLIPFGGADGAEQTCGRCPANVALPPDSAPRWAGCHGMLVVHDLARLEEKIGGSWHRLWIGSPLDDAALAEHAETWGSVPSDDSAIEGLPAYLRATEAARADRTGSMLLHVKAYPPGIRSGRTWQVPAHCRRCSAVREEASAECPVCGSTDAPEPARR